MDRRVIAARTAKLVEGLLRRLAPEAARSWVDLKVAGSDEVGTRLRHHRRGFDYMADNDKVPNP
jgi:hypothetical protein